jgi:hypothetical protein
MSALSVEGLTGRFGDLTFEVGGASGRLKKTVRRHGAAKRPGPKSAKRRVRARKTATWLVRSVS